MLPVTSPSRFDVPLFGPLSGSNQIICTTAAHEQAAGHMAEGYARASRKAGVVLVDNGYGLTNLVTPMQDALCDGTPMVVICGPTFAKSSNPSVDVTEVARHCTKWSLQARSLAEMRRRLTEAFSISTSGRPGPVLIEIPRLLDTTVSSQDTTLSVPRRHLLCPVESTKLLQESKEFQNSLQRIARLMNMSQKPILYVGQGMLSRDEGYDILRDFANRLNVPVTTSLQGLGAFDELDHKAVHMLGLHGTGYANMAIQEADLIIALGARFDDRVTGNVSKFAPTARAAAAKGRGGIIQVDIAPKNINKTIDVTEAIQGDCAMILDQLTPLIDTVEDRSEWFSQIATWKTQHPLHAYKSASSPSQPVMIQAQAVIDTLSEITNPIKDRTIITTGVGQHQMWAAQHYRWRYPRSMITSGGLGTMGFGLPAAIGAKLARPDHLVIDIDGDASFNMTMVELATAARDNIAIKVLLLNNEQMGMVSDLQRLYYNHKFVHNRQKNPDFVSACQALGVSARRCSNPTDVGDMLKWLIETDGPAVLEVVTEGNSPVWPVVPAGKGLHEFVTYTT